MTCILLLLLLPLLPSTGTPGRLLSPRRRGEMRWRVWNILAHISQDYAYYIFKCNRGGYSSTTIVCWLLYCNPLVAGFLLGDRIPCYMGTESGHRSPFHGYSSKYLSTSRASRLLVETPSYPKGKNIYTYIYISTRALGSTGG